MKNILGFLALVSTLSNTVSAVYNPVTGNSNIKLNRENLVQGYFLRGFTYQEIISFLALISSWNHNQFETTAPDIEENGADKEKREIIF